MKGVPVRVEVGKRDLEGGVATLVRRDTGDKSTAPLGDVVSAVRAIFEAQSESMRAKALKYFDVRTRSSRLPPMCVFVHLLCV